MKRMTMLFVLILITGTILFPQNNGTNATKKQFIYVLKLEKKMYDATAWTPETTKIIEDHFARLQKMLADGSLIFAGRTQMPPEKTFGIVVFETDSIKKAKEIAENDPGVKGGIMTVEVYPYEVALMRGVK